jgi:hypothetical protein
MVNTLRITSVAALVFATLVLVSLLGPRQLVNLGMKSDARLEGILAEPNAVDRFKKDSAGKTTRNTDEVPMLVKQAKAFKNIIDPKREPNQPRIQRPTRADQPKVDVPPPVTPVFSLIGLSYSAASPDESFAYIRFVDNTVQWVRKGDVIGHLTIQEIKRNSILCTSDGRENEITVTAPPETAGILETSAGTSATRQASAASDKPAANTVAKSGADGGDSLDRLTDMARRSTAGGSSDPNTLLRDREAFAGGMTARGSESEEARSVKPLSSVKRSAFRSSTIAPPISRGN